MNRAAEALYLLMLNSGKLDTAETERAFYSAYDYILDMAECEENGEERGKCPLPGKIDTKKHTKVE